MKTIFLIVLATFLFLTSCAPAKTFNYYTGEEFRDKTVEEATGEKITGNVLEKIFNKNDEAASLSGRTIYSDESWDNAVICTYSPPTNPIPGAEWIWEAGWPESCIVNKTINIDDNLISANLEIAVDNFYILYVNGIEIGRKDDNPSWDRVDTYNIKRNLKSGTNDISVEAWNEYNQVGISIKIVIE